MICYHISIIIYDNILMIYTDIYFEIGHRRDRFITSVLASEAGKRSTLTFNFAFVAKSI